MYISDGNAIELCLREIFTNNLCHILFTRCSRAAEASRQLRKIHEDHDMNTAHATSTNRLRRSIFCPKQTGELHYESARMEATSRSMLRRVCGELKKSLSARKFFEIWLKKIAASRRTPPRTDEFQIKFFSPLL